MKKDNLNYAKKILENRPNENLRIAISQTLKLTLYAALIGVAMLLIAMFEENQMYIPYAIYTISEFVILYVCAREFQKEKKYRFLLLAVLLFSLTFLLERYHLGGLYEPMKNNLPTVIHTGAGRSVGLVKSLAIMAPTLYLWTKIMFGVIWGIMLFNALRLKRIKF